MPAHNNSHFQPNTDAMSSDHRKNSKPVMEKRRRARINQYLSELKTLILEAMKKDPARHSKLEKADILEMTVRHLHQVQRQQVASAISNDPAVWAKFRSGFCECANEVRRYLSKMEGVDNGLKQRLLNYLNICMNCMNSLPSPNMSTFLPSLSGLMPQFHPLAMQLAASIQGFKPEMSLTDSQATEAGKMFGAALLQGRLQNTDMTNLLPSSTETLSTNIPEDLSNKPLTPNSPPPSFRISMESLVSPSIRSLSDGRASSSEGSFKSPGTSASTSSEKEFSPRKVNLDNSPRALMFKFPISGNSIQRPIPKHASTNPVFPVAASSSADDSGSEDEPVWRPW